MSGADPGGGGAPINEPDAAGHPPHRLKFPSRARYVLSKEEDCKLTKNVPVAGLGWYFHQRTFSTFCHEISYDKCTTEYIYIYVQMHLIPTAFNCIGLLCILHHLRTAIGLHVKKNIVYPLFSLIYRQSNSKYIVGLQLLGIIITLS